MFIATPCFTTTRSNLPEDGLPGLVWDVGSRPVRSYNKIWAALSCVRGLPSTSPCNHPRDSETPQDIRSTWCVPPCRSLSKYEIRTFSLSFDGEDEVVVTATEDKKERSVSFLTHTVTKDEKSRLNKIDIEVKGYENGDSSNSDRTWYSVHVGDTSQKFVGAVIGTNDVGTTGTTPKVHTLAVRSTDTLLKDVQPGETISIWAHSKFKDVKNIVNSVTLTIRLTKTKTEIVRDYHALHATEGTKLDVDWQGSGAPEESDATFKARFQSSQGTLYVLESTKHKTVCLRTGNINVYSLPLVQISAITSCADFTESYRLRQVADPTVYVYAYFAIFSLTTCNALPTTTSPVHGAQPIFQASHFGSSSYKRHAPQPIRDKRLLGEGTQCQRRTTIPWTSLIHPVNLYDDSTALPMGSVLISRTLSQYPQT
ncbi:hypothetical protein NM688_g4328 [Phlebia brevispora]|uniref:Uncharacterized protein n=1 Tax=Phlebia brevispora TaxID=194682 RepID=A0ACC1T376_9APHY|nr:hypothetical protein NM688_g4328 [Phlebia brevispora]